MRCPLPRITRPAPSLRTGRGGGDRERLRRRGGDRERRPPSPLPPSSAFASASASGTSTSFASTAASRFAAFFAAFFAFLFAFFFAFFAFFRRRRVALSSSLLSLSLLLLLLLLLLEAAAFVLRVDVSPATTPQSAMTTGVCGRSLPSVSTISMRLTSAIPSATSPNTTCLPSRCGVVRNVMKNCDPLVPGPAFAIDNRPGRI